MAQIEYSLIKVSELPSFFDRYSKSRGTQHVLPISPQRAHSQAANPSASESDIGLIVAYDGEIVVGYLGLLPAHFLTPEGPVKFLWASSLYVSHLYRGRRIAQELYSRAFALNLDVVGCELTPEAYSLYVKINTQDLGFWDYLKIDIVGIDIFYGFLKKIRETNIVNNSKVLRKIFNILIKAEVKLVYPLFKSWFYIFKTFPGGGNLSEIKGFDGNTRLPKIGFLRDKRYVNWMVKYPWVKDNKPPEKPNYNFADVRKEFKYLGIREPDASAVISKSTDDNGKIQLKVIDLFWPDQDLVHSRQLLNAILSFAKECKADQINFLPMEWSDQLRFYGKALLRGQRRYIYWPIKDSVLKKYKDEIHFMPADGDSGFW